MQVGCSDPIEDTILQLGFEIKNDIVLLGMSLTDHSPCFDNNCEKIVQKIKKQTNFWKRFNLSLPGRISIAKTFLYSQINYLGCFMPMKHNELKKMSDEIENFVGGKLKIAKNRYCENRENGGLGLFNLKTFLAAQSCTWLKRSFTPNEFWKQELHRFSYGNIFNLRVKNFDKKMNPILCHIVSSYEMFMHKFTVYHENFLKSWILENPCFTFDVGRKLYLKETFFSQDEWVTHSNALKSLTIEQFLLPNKTILSRGEFLENTGINLSELKYNKLKCLVRTAILNFSKTTIMHKKCDTIQNFCMRIKRGCKKFRKILEPEQTRYVTSNIFKLAELTDTVINSEKSARLNSLWGIHTLDNSLRTFLFKFHNNALGTNSRVSHFVQNHDRTCTFCNLLNVPEENDETISHLFFECSVVEEFLMLFQTWLYNSNAPVHMNRNDFFGGSNHENKSKNIVLDILHGIVKKFIWDCKLRHTLPNFELFRHNFISEFKLQIKINRSIRENSIKSGLFTNHNEFNI